MEEPRLISRDDRGKKVMLISSALVCVLILGGSYVLGFTSIFAVQYDRANAQATTTNVSLPAQPTPVVQYPLPLNVAAYNAKLLADANDPYKSAPQVSSTTSSLASSTSSTTPVRKPLWPVSTTLPEGGALLPFHRIVAYYGNFYSTKMGVLGEYPPQQMLQMLNQEVAAWNAADPSTPVIPGIDYIAVTAQGSPGVDGMYRLRMPASQIDEALALANQEHGVLILDIQVGLSTVETEVPLLATYLKQPNVELALDPEFAMHNGAVPGSEIGSLDASDVNWAANYLAGIVTANKLPPKILIVHRFTEDMVTRSQDITPLPQVQIVMDMDGWGSPAKKMNTYQQFIELQPVQFTGFKLFYVNDLRAPSTGMMTPAEVLKLTPEPLFIQYQ